MLPLLAGLILFLGMHSLRVVAEPWRQRTLARVGEGRWKVAVSLLSLLGFALLVWGYGQARQQPVVVWSPPLAMRHVAGLLTLVAFVLLAASSVPRNAIRAKLRHPMTLAVKVWALAHLLANGTLHDMLLFGAFLVWSVLVFRAARARDRAAGSPPLPAGTAAGTAATVVFGVLAWAVFAFWAHGVLIGVRPFG